MGSCYSIPLFLENNIENKQCMICSNEISIQNGIYLKCSKCKILLHKSCSKKCKCKSNTNTNTNKLNILYCPHCKHRNSLISYNNNLNNYKK